MAIIGIDLGTPNSAAAVLRGGRPVIIPGAEGVSLGDDPRFQRDGADLWREEVLPLTDPVLGTKLEVPILEGGGVGVKVSAGAQPDTVLRLGYKGLPEFGSKGKGDLYPQVKLKEPETLSREERKLYERLRALAGKTKRHFLEQKWAGR